jgi:hypothetical protein
MKKAQEISAERTGRKRQEHLQPHEARQTQRPIAVKLSLMATNLHFTCMKCFANCSIELASKSQSILIWAGSFAGPHDPCLGPYDNTAPCKEN